MQAEEPERQEEEEDGGAVGPDTGPRSAPGEVVRTKLTSEELEQARPIAHGGSISGPRVPNDLSKRQILAEKTRKATLRLVVQLWNETRAVEMSVEEREHLDALQSMGLSVEPLCLLSGLNGSGELNLTPIQRIRPAHLGCGNEM